MPLAARGRVNRCVIILLNDECSQELANLCCRSRLVGQRFCDAHVRKGVCTALSSTRKSHRPFREVSGGNQHTFEHRDVAEPHILLNSLKGLLHLLERTFKHLCEKTVVEKQRSRDVVGRVIDS